MIRYFVILVMCLSGLSQAESGGTVPGAAPAVPVSPPANAAANSGFNRLNPNTIQVFDNDFFKPTPQGTQESSSPRGRAYAEDPKYNTENRQRALDKCEYLRNQNYTEYQKCYQKDLANVKKGIQEGYDEVEKKQSMPLKNSANPLIDEQTRNPSGFTNDD